MLNFENIIKSSQRELKHKLNKELKVLQYKTINSDGFLYGKGDIPILLIAHLDTVHKEGVKTICYSKDNKVMSPQGIGGDDRCGIYMIIKIIKELRCHVLFCEDEEKGCIGAGKFCKSDIKPDVNFIIELDRMGANDAVFYDCDNKDFTNFITQFGFQEEWGTFSDISEIAPHLGVAAVNISSGYYNAHTKHEYIDMNVVKRNIDKVKNIIKNENGTFYEYIEIKYYTKGLGLGLGYLGYEDAYIYDDVLMELYDEDGFIVDDKNDVIEAGGYYINEDLDVFKENDFTLSLVENAFAYTPEGDLVKFDISRSDWYSVEI